MPPKRFVALAFESDDEDKSPPLPPPLPILQEDEDMDMTPTRARAAVRPVAFNVEDEQEEMVVDEVAGSNVIKHRSIHHIKIGKDRSMQVVILLENRCRKWLTDEIFKKIMASLKHLLLPKLLRESQSKDPGCCDICIGDNFQFAYYLTQTPVRQSLLVPVPSTSIYTPTTVFHQTLTILPEPRTFPKRRQRTVLELIGVPKRSEDGELEILDPAEVDGFRVGEGWVKYGKECVVAELSSVLRPRQPCMGNV
ncbi:hypothetical protein HDU97_007610 [Phlyctochytrium planicorne]|nr:hypothetical protein HDU97_007610 [Phlyctochytrium planicorne]